MSKVYQKSLLKEVIIMRTKFLYIQCAMKHPSLYHIEFKDFHIYLVNPFGFIRII